MEARIEKIKQQLQSQGYKLTPQREATVRVLLENEEDHLSAEDVFMLVKDKAPEIGLATVYRTLELLSEMHVVEKINFGDGVARYDLRTDSNKHHHHANSNPHPNQPPNPLYIMIASIYPSMPLTTRKPNPKQREKPKK